MQIKGITIKNPRPKEAKTKDLKPILSCTNEAEPSEQKKKDQKDKKKFQQKRERKDTLATDDNAIDAPKKKRRQNLSKVKCFTCNKKNYYASDYIKSPKN